MYHHPEATDFISLKLDEVISASESCELNRSFVTALGVDVGMTQGHRDEIFRLSSCRLAFMPSGGYSSPNLSQDLTGHSRIF
jgi:hypothetical protein